MLCSLYIRKLYVPLQICKFVNTFCTFSGYYMQLCECWLSVNTHSIYKQTDAEKVTNIGTYRQDDSTPQIQAPTFMFNRRISSYSCRAELLCALLNSDNGSVCFFMRFSASVYKSAQSSTFQPGTALCIDLIQNSLLAGFSNSRAVQTNMFTM